MPALGELIPLNGKWQGTNKLRLSPGEPVRESDSLAESAPLPRGNLARCGTPGPRVEKPRKGELLSVMRRQARPSTPSGSIPGT